ncbi:MAG: hypothetical protein AAGD07_05405 [Planctomycetota bacterium]
MNCLASVCTLLTTIATAAIANEDVANMPTHRSTKVIEIADGNRRLQLSAFCLNRDGHIVAICGNGSGEVRIVNDDGEILRSWPVGIRPEAVAVNDQGEILVGGEGRLLRFDATGEELQQAEAPHAFSVRTDTKQLRKAVIRQLTASRSSNPIASRIALYERVLVQLEAKGKRTELNDQEMRMLELIPQNLARFREQVETEEKRAGKTTKPSEDQIQKFTERLVQSSMKISSISAHGDHVFIATQAPIGFGFDVWRTSGDFGDGKKIIAGLRGCCGQMDVQCCPSGVFVAENARHRVVRYDVDGNELAQWGSRARTGFEGFSGCCNPMNVCFDGDGSVFTSESTTGRIKRFRSDGETMALVGEIELSPGCKTVSIAASTDGRKVYVLDVSRSRIVVLQEELALSRLKVEVPS